MPEMLRTKRREATSVPQRACAAPAWVNRMIDDAAARRSDGLLIRQGREFSLHSAAIVDAADLPADELERRTFELYAALASGLQKTRHPYPVRFWNHLPGITEKIDDRRDRYMVFNAGRYRAFHEWHGGQSRFECELATASATGHSGRDLIVHCLSAAQPGRPIVNPRQVAPYHYSRRFGPLPPCFARATRLACPENLLLVGGTASVRGEDSIHDEDLEAQCRETFINLASIISAAMGAPMPAGGCTAQLAAAFCALRIYHPVRSDRAMIEPMIRDHFKQLETIEWFDADLCRAELRVEIEGLADLSRME